MDDAIEALVTYFTGPLVGFYSVALNIPDGPMHLADKARQFFKLREALGIRGYDDETDARKALKKLFSK